MTTPPVPTVAKTRRNIKSIAQTIIGTAGMCGALVLYHLIFERRHDVALTRDELILPLGAFTISAVIGFRHTIKEFATDTLIPIINAIRGKKNEDK